MQPKRSFFIGEEWLYYKIYSGPKTADNILLEALKPVTEALFQAKVIEKWFFIRYNDPNPHLRVRFLLSNPESLFPIASMMKKVLSPYLQSGLVSTIQTDTYHREIERYGSNTICLAESLFFYDSQFATETLEIWSDQDNVRWGIGLLSMDRLLQDFGYTLDEKFHLLSMMSDSFSKEHHLDKALRMQLGKKYRKDSSFISQMINMPELKPSEYQSILDAVEKRSEKNKALANEVLDLQEQDKLERSLNHLMGSYLHMVNNRLFKSKQRKYEFVLYFYLYQYYRSALARSGKKIEKKVAQL